MFSKLVYVGDGANITFPITFTLGFLSRSEVKCRVADEVDGSDLPVYRTITWINDGMVTISGAPPAVDAEVVFTRTVSKTILQHDYEDGAIITEGNLDDSNKQLMMAIHELLDGRFEASPGIGDGDFVTVAQLQAAIDDLQDQIDAINVTLGTIVQDAIDASLAAVAAAIAAAIAAALADFSVQVVSDKVFHVREVQAAGVKAGSFVSGAWRTRVLNTTVLNEISGASLAANRITLPAGTYTCDASAPASQVLANKLRLYNITNSSTIILGPNSLSEVNDASLVCATLFCKFTLTEESVLELQHICRITHNTDGLGPGYDFGVSEVYTDLIFRQQGTSAGGGSTAAPIYLGSGTLNLASPDTIDLRDFAAADDFDRYEIRLRTITSPSTGNGAITLKLGNQGVVEGADIYGSDQTGDTTTNYTCNSDFITFTNATGITTALTSGSGSIILDSFLNSDVTVSPWLEWTLMQFHKTGVGSPASLKTRGHGSASTNTKVWDLLQFSSTAAFVITYDVYGLTHG